VLKRLPNGTQLLIRRIRPDDKPLLQQALSNLSELSVQRRFLGPKPRFSQAELRYLTEVDDRNHVALVAESPSGPSRQLIGVARFVRDPENPESAEVAIVVADYWHGRGVGSTLARELASRARVLGIRCFTASMASDNRPARRLFEKLTDGLEQRPGPHGVSELSLAIAA